MRRRMAVRARWCLWITGRRGKNDGATTNGRWGNAKREEGFFVRRGGL